MLFRIRAVALYELLNLLRSRIFYIYIGSATLLAAALLWGINSQWARHGIPSSIPYITFLFLNFTQTLVAVYLASGFFSRERRAKSFEAISIRSFFNPEYLLGKLGAVAILFLAVNTLILLLTLVSNAVFPDVPVVIKTYLVYLLFVPLPSVLYISGLTFFLMTVFKSRPLVTITLTVYVIATSIELDVHFYYLFDFMGTNIPFLYSDFAGFGRMFPMLFQRLMYVGLGSSLFLLSVPLYHNQRLMQSRRMTVSAVLMAVLIAFAALFSGQRYLKSIQRGQTLRAELRALNDVYALKPAVDVQRYDLAVRHEGCEIAAEGALTFLNNTGSAIDTLIFSLNPGFAVETIRYHGTEIQYSRKLSIIEAVLPQALMPGSVDSLIIGYRGSVDEDACYIDIDERFHSFVHRFNNMPIDKRYAFITPDYLLLTREALWYPLAGVPPGPEHPYTGSGFSTFTLNVTTMPGLTAISQGSVTESDEGRFRFEPEYPLTQITLVIGEYSKKAVSVDGVEYAVYYQRDRDFFSRYFTEIGDSMPEIISDLKSRFEFELGLDYPFKRFTLVETPIQFLAQQRDWTLAAETVQPEMLLLPEKGVLLTSIDLERRKKSLERIYRSHALTEKEIQTRLLQSTIKVNFFYVLSFQRQHRLYTVKQMEKSKRKGMPFGSSLFEYNYNVLPMYNVHASSVASADNTELGRALALYFRSKQEHTRGSMEIPFKGDIRFDTSYDIARRALSDASLEDVKDNPGFTALMTDILECKSEQLFLTVASEIGVEKFDTFLNDFYTANRFRTVSPDDFVRALRESLGYDITPHLTAFREQPGLPAYVMSDVRCHDYLEDGNKKKYQLLFTVSNLGTADGVFETILYPVGKFDNDYRNSRITHIKAGLTKEIGMVFDEEPNDAVFFKTFLSANNPNKFVEHFTDTGTVEGWKTFDGERTIPTPVERIPEGTIIVDNADPGFSIQAVKRAGLVGIFFRDQPSENEPALRADFLKPPKRWRTVMEVHFYGSGGFEKNGCMVRGSNKGRQSVSWKADIPEAGDYDVFFNVPYFRPQFDIMRRIPGSHGITVWDFNFQVSTAAGMKNVKLDLSDEESGWKLLGSWSFNNGPAEIILTDQSRGNIVFADAVKWVKR